MMKFLTILFQILAVLLSDVMCAVVAYNYSDMLWGIKYLGYSAPANTALLFALPFLAGITALLWISFIFRKKIK